MDAAPRPPLFKRVPPGWWMAISWCAIMVYAFSGVVLAPLPAGPLWPRLLFDVQTTVTWVSWPALAMSGVVVLSAVLVRHRPLPALGLLLAAAIVAARVPQPAEADASFLIAPTAVAVGFIAATAPRRVSVPVAVIALGVLASYGTNWKGAGLTADSWPLAVVIAWLIGQSIRQNRLHAATLRTRAEAAAVTAERLRITGDLHDMVAHAVGVIAIQAGAGSRVIDTRPAEARDALRAIETTSRETLAGLRRTLGALRRAEPGEEPAPAPGQATTRRPVSGRLLPVVLMVASWCAVIVYVVSAQVLGPGGFLILAPGVPRPIPTHLAGLLAVLEGVAAVPWPLLAMACVVVLSALLVRRWPLPALAVLLAGAVAAWLIPAPMLIGHFPTLLALWAPGFYLIPPAGVAVGYVATTRSALVSIGAAIIAAGVLAHSAGRFMPAGFPNGASGVLAAVVAIVIAWLIGHSIRQYRSHVETLRTQAEVTAVTAERLRIARELHDTVAHSIGVIAIQAGTGGRVIDTQPAEAGNALSAIEAISREALAGLRQTLGAPRTAGPGPGLQPAPLDLAPGLASIGQLVATAMGAGVCVDVQWRGQRHPLPADIDQSAFRIIQEAVTNVVRHAGTGHCQVVIDQQDDEVTLEVVDDGRGSLAGDAGYGITGMRERARLLHGQLAAGPRPEGGFRVTARLPLPVAAAAR